MITKDEVFDGCVMILSAILGVRPYTAMMKKMGKMWILACCQLSQLVPASIWGIFCSCEWSQWNVVKGLEIFVLCVMCMHVWFWGVSLSSSGCAGSWFILGFISLSCVGLCFNVGCLVFCVYCSLCVHVPASGDVISGMCVVPDQSSWHFFKHQVCVSKSSSGLKR